LAWVAVMGVVGICLFAQMAGRVAAVSGRATLEIIRQRLGPPTAAANLSASFFINLMTLSAEIGGVALALQLATDVGRMVWIPLAAFAVWVVIWCVKFAIMENVAGLVGMCLIVFVVAVFALHPNGVILLIRRAHRSSRRKSPPRRTGVSPSRCSAPR
jgi:Mn2+/Fe2+ NRAMP family transporter